MRFKILVVDDEPILRESLEVALKTSGYEVMTAHTGEEGLERFKKENPDLILLDHWLPGINGDEVLRRIKERDPEIPIIVMTAQGSIEMAVNLMKMGAFDYLGKPFELDQMEDLIKKGLDRVRLKKEVEWLRAQYQERFRSGGIIGVSQKMKDVLELAEKLAQGAETTVLIEGETGTGKELLAEYIHFLSSRSSFPFIPINCGAIPKDLFESDLFGYERGAVRVIAATNRDLESEVKKGNFRDDLYFRLNVVKLHIPPLRERKEDILPFFRFFMDRFNEQFKKRFVKISEEAEEHIIAYPWSGNIREL